MQIYKPDNDTRIVFENNTSRVYKISDLSQQKIELAERIGAYVAPTDEEKLAWANENYPFIDHSKEVEELEKIEELLDLIK
jgi:hypothetical protein